MYMRNLILRINLTLQNKSLSVELIYFLCYTHYLRTQLSIIRNKCNYRSISDTLDCPTLVISYIIQRLLCILYGQFIKIEQRDTFVNYSGLTRIIVAA